MNTVIHEDATNTAAPQVEEFETPSSRDFVSFVTSWFTTFLLWIER